MFILSLLLACTSPAPLQQPSPPPEWPLTNGPVAGQADPKDAAVVTEKSATEAPPKGDAAQDNTPVKNTDHVASPATPSAP